MKTIILAASLAAMMASPIMVQQSLAATHRAHVVRAPAQCSDPGAHQWCAATPNHINDGAESAGSY